MFAILSKIFGVSIKSGGITGGDTLATPDTLDEMGKAVRGLVDKKYKLKKKIEEEYNEELNNHLYQINILWNFISKIKMTKVHKGFMIGHKLNQTEIDILKYIGVYEDFISGTNMFGNNSNFSLSNFTSSQIIKFNDVIHDLKNQEENIKIKIKEKYDIKFIEMSKYL